MRTLALLLLAACEGAPEAGPAERRLTLAAYTTPREAYAEILPAFAAHWKEKTGETVTFEESYQASGAQARAVREGFQADVVALSLAPDVEVLVEAGLVAPEWSAGPERGLVTESLVVLAVRPGNPKQLRDWADLTRPDVEVLTPNVRTSGGAMWNVSALYGAAIRGRAGVPANDPAAAQTLLGGVLGRVRVMDKGARESIVTFEKGTGDVAITYENEVLVARAAGRPMDYVVPPSTIVIENPIAVVNGYAEPRGNLDVANAFVAFTRTPEAQAIYAKHGLRPLDAAQVPADWPRPDDAFRVSDLGGWTHLKEAVFAKGALYDRAVAAP